MGSAGVWRRVKGVHARTRLRWSLPLFRRAVLVVRRSPGRCKREICAECRRFVVRPLDRTKAATAHTMRSSLFRSRPLPASPASPPHHSGAPRCVSPALQTRQIGARRCWCSHVLDTQSWTLPCLAAPANGGPQMITATWPAALARGTSHHPGQRSDTMAVQGLVPDKNRVDGCRCMLPKRRRFSDVCYSSVC